MANSPKLYVDSCCFIDAVKSEVGLLPNGRDDDVWFLKKLMQAHYDKQVQLYTSVVTLSECVAVKKGQTDVPPVVQDHFRRLLTSGQFVRLHTPTPKTSRLVQELRWTHNLVLKGLDSVHVATALETECLEFFSTDDRLTSDKLVKAIPVLTALKLKMTTPKHTAYLPEKYRQADILK